MDNMPLFIVAQKLYLMRRRQEIYQGSEGRWVFGLGLGFWMQEYVSVIMNELSLLRNQ